MTPVISHPATASIREVVVGRHSTVWRAAASNPSVASRFRVQIGHAELPQFGFTHDDRVWVFAYSLLPSENSRLLATLKAAAVREVVYVSSASTIVVRVTRCYQYPLVKQHAEDEARRLLSARILTLGIVYQNLAELPAGDMVATSQATLQEFLLAPHWPDDGATTMRLFEIVRRPFRAGGEALLQRSYARVQWLVRRWPCVLRPLDYLLRACGFRWYGYVCLSNRLWTTMK